MTVTYYGPGDPMDLAYLAGYIDADGSMGVFSGQSQPRIIIQVTSKNSGVLEWIKTIFGGGLYHYTGSEYNPTKTFYKWMLYDRRAQNMARLLEPYLKDKVEQARLMQRFPISTRGVHLTEDDKILRDDIYFEIRRLNNSVGLLLRS